MSIIFTSPKPIPSRPRRRKYASETSQRNPLPAAAPRSESAKRKDRRGGREREQVIGDEQRGSVSGPGEQAEHERQAEAGEIHGVGEYPLAQIGEHQHDHQRRKYRPFEGLRGKPEGQIACQEEQGVQQFHYRIHPGNCGLAGAAFAAAAPDS